MFRHMLRIALLIALSLLAVAQQTATKSDQPSTSVAPKTVEITPATARAEVGQQLKFSAVAKDATGQVLDQKASIWFAAPFDLAAADGANVTFYEPGEVKVGAVIGGKTGYATVTVAPAKVAKIEIAPLPAPLPTGVSTLMRAVAKTAGGEPRSGVEISWSSEAPSIATISPAGLITAVAPGRTTIRAKSGDASGTMAVQVERNKVQRLSVTPATTSARTGDVIHFTARASDKGGTSIKDAYVTWQVGGGGAAIYPDGGFVAEQPGTYLVTANSGAQSGSATISVSPRNVERQLKTVGRIPIKDTQVAEQWIIGNNAYISSIADKVWVYDIADPANPKLLDTLTVDARLINDVSTTPDGKIGVITREGASTRKNGIVFLDTSDPKNIKVLSEYTATVTGGVHSAFIHTHYVYLTDDATGSLRVIDFQDPKNPKEVARWQVETPNARTIETPQGAFSGGRYLHDLYVKDGLAYLAYWRDGLVILDVGAGIKGGSPEKPQLVSQYRFNHNELYGTGWLAGTHAVYRYKNYVYCGDEVFPAEFDLHSRERIPVRGMVHVIDVSDIQHPHKVAEYPVPEAGSHNIWVLDDVLYMGYYNGGGRVLDVSGELRGDLYRQGREIARLWTGDSSGFRPNLPFAWGAQPHNGLVYYNDVHTGLWIVKLGPPRDKGSATAPGLQE